MFVGRVKKDDHVCQPTKYCVIAAGKAPTEDNSVLLLRSVTGPRLLRSGRFRSDQRRLDQPLERRLLQRLAEEQIPRQPRPVDRHLEDEP